MNELTQRTIGQTQVSLSYDDAGSLSQDGSANGDHKFKYDYRNRLIEVQEYQTDTWNDTAEYKYDALNRRVLKVVTNKGGLNGTTRFLWGGAGDWQCLEELASDDDIVARFTYSPGYIDAVAIQERDLNADNDFSDANEVVYYHTNTLFSAYALSDASESVVERYRYDAYGSCTVLDADGSVDADGLSDVKNPYLFTGRRLDLETGLMQYRNRYYSSVLGQFASRDPIGYRGGLNLYEYARSRPELLTDPSGRFGAKTWACITCAAGAAVAIGSCTAMCAGGGYWDKPGESFGSCFGKCLVAALTECPVFDAALYAACALCYALPKEPGLPQQPPTQWSCAPCPPTILYCEIVGIETTCTLIYQTWVPPCWCHYFCPYGLSPGVTPVIPGTPVPVPFPEP